MYLLDTNIFIESHKYLPTDVFPSFWNVLGDLANKGKICSIDKVKNEIVLGGDDDPVVIFCKGLPKNFFTPFDPRAMVDYQKSMQWAQTCGRYNQKGIAAYSDSTRADAFLVATASYYKYTLVTYEKPDKPTPNPSGNIKIPDAAAELGVHCCSVSDVFRDLGIVI